MRMLRSSSQLVLPEPKFNFKTYGSRAFSVCAPGLWNSLPLEIRMCDSIDTFKRKLIRHTFLRVHIPVSFICILVLLLLLLFFGTCEALLDIVMKSALYK